MITSRACGTLGAILAPLPTALLHLPLQVDKGYVDVFGVLGLARLEAGPALVVITGIEQVGWRQGEHKVGWGEGCLAAWLAGWLAWPGAKVGM